MVISAYLWISSDIMTLEETEALIQVYGKSESAKDRFLGQINVPVKVCKIRIRNNKKRN